jgi:polysaccharide biosynthesis/export protein
MALTIESIDEIPGMNAPIKPSRTVATLAGLAFAWRRIGATRALRLRRLTSVLALLAAALLQTVAFAAAPPAPPVTITAAPPSTLQELGPGDSVNVQVFGQPDMTGTVLVGDDGTISLPIVGSVKIAGLSSIQAGQRVAQALKSGQFLVDPHVNITIVQSHSQRVSVIGEVRTPGRYAIEPDTSIVELLAQAGGPTENSSDTVFVLRTDAQGNVVRHAVDLHGYSAGSGALPIETLQGGDSIIVPRAETFYVYGEVSRPNMYKLTSGLTVIQAIALAGGVTPRGSNSRIDVKRAGANGSYVTTRVKPNDLVRADDVIYVRERIF